MSEVTSESEPPQSSIQFPCSQEREREIAKSISCWEKYALLSALRRFWGYFKVIKIIGKWDSKVKERDDWFIPEKSRLKVQWFRSVENSEAEERGQHFSASARERTRGNGSAEQHVELKINTKHSLPTISVIVSWNTKDRYRLFIEKKKKKIRGAWVAQWVKTLPSARVMVSGSWDWSPHRALCSAGSLLPSLSLPATLPILWSLSVK